MQNICNYLGIKLPRTKFLKWKKRNLNYSKICRKTKSTRKTLTRSLLHLFYKIELTYGFEMPKLYAKRREIISKIYEQQHHLFSTGEYPKNRIVSITKYYLRPIVRGKEIKKSRIWSKIK